MHTLFQLNIPLFTNLANIKHLLLCYSHTQKTPFYRKGVRLLNRSSEITQLVNWRAKNLNSAPVARIFLIYRWQEAEMLALLVVIGLLVALAGYASYFQADPRILEFANCLPPPHPGPTYSGCCRTECGLHCVATPT